MMLMVGKGVLFQYIEMAIVCNDVVSTSDQSGINKLIVVWVNVDNGPGERSANADYTGQRDQEFEKVGGNNLIRLSGKNFVIFQQNSRADNPLKLIINQCLNKRA